MPVPGAVVARSCEVLLAVCSVVAYLILSKPLLNFQLVVEEMYDVACSVIGYDLEHLQRDGWGGVGLMCCVVVRLVCCRPLVDIVVVAWLLVGLLCGCWCWGWLL